MNERTKSILEAAQTVFAKYGVAKTTMSDIAQAAGVARQTVYNAFATKNDILREALRVEIENTISMVSDAWQRCDTLGARIQVFHDLGPLRWYEAIQSYPDLAELYEGLHVVAADELARGKTAWEQLFREMFEAHGIACKDPSISTAALADFMYYSAKNAKYEADGMDGLKQRLYMSKVALLQMTDQQ